MANGAGAEEFVLVSGARSGLKREFAFALKSHTDMDGSIGRTRGKKCGTESPVFSNKRFKSSDDDELEKEKENAQIDVENLHVDEKHENGCVDEDLEVDLVKSAETKTDFEKSLVEGEKSVAENGTPMVVDEKSEEKKDFVKSPSRRFTRSCLKTKEETMDMTENALEKFANDEQISGTDVHSELLKSPIKEAPIDGEKCAKEHGNGSGSDTPVVIDGNCETPNAVMETPARRFTRSVLKPKVEPAEVSATSSGSTVVSEDACKSEMNVSDYGKLSDAISPLKETPKSNLEMKMSKKIASTKFPSNVKELMETGLLEGCHVTYIFKSKERRKLSGVIKDRGVVCSCSSCKGHGVFTLYDFEKHAGSTYKHPSNHLYLDNGNSLRDVVVACKEAPLDTVEETVKNCIGASCSKLVTICQNCQGRLPESCTASLCNSCLESKNCESSPACVAVSNPRFSKADATPRSSASKGKLTRKDLRLHKLVFEEDGLPDGTELGYYVRGKKLLEGFKKGFGIFCRCCNSVVSASQFEAHAGYATRRKPYLNIYTSNGVSLHELSVSMSRGRKFAPSYNDDLCSICSDFGDLLLCDGCPRAFHQDCLGLSKVPTGKWYCRYCLSMYEREKACQYNENAKAAGRISGVDPIEQITKRCIRIVETLEATETGGCILCRRQCFTKSFGPQTVILCDQCENEYHVGCLKDHNMADLKELPEGNWFCCGECNRIHTAMQKLIVHGSEKLPDTLVSVLKKKQTTATDIDVRWRVLSGKAASPESKLLLSKAVAIFHERFDPIVDAKTGRDLIPSMVYGRSVRDQDFGGMYCTLLTVNSTVVSAGIIRIFGTEVAELPLVATNTDYQGQGYFQSLFSCIERLLGFLKVKNLMLPAAEEAESIWTNKFGFRKMTPDELAGSKKKGQLMTFQGTAMLQKPVPPCRVIHKAPLK